VSSSEVTLERRALSKSLSLERELFSGGSLLKTKIVDERMIPI
jgi:hypothetical protein